MTTITVELAEGDVLVGILVHDETGVLKLRTQDQPARSSLEEPSYIAPITFAAVFVHPDTGAVTFDSDTFTAEDVVVPTSWPRGIDVPARAYREPTTRRIVLLKPLCKRCAGTGTDAALLTGVCAVCDGDGEYHPRSAPGGESPGVAPAVGKP